MTLATTDIGFAQVESPSVSKAELCAEPQNAKNPKTEASAECIECLFGKQLEVPKSIAGLSGLEEKIPEETEREKIEREALTYLVLAHYYKSLGGMLINSEDVNFLVDVYFRAKNKGEKPSSDVMSRLQLFFSKDELNKLTQEQTKELIESRILKAKISESQKLKKKSTEELKKAILNMKEMGRMSKQLLCGHDQLEYQSIAAYTENLYFELNRILRESSPDSEEAKYFAPYVATLKKGLEKIKDYPHTVYRGVHFSQEELDKYQPGEVITLAAFTSTSRKPEFINDWGTVGMEIKSASGKSIEYYSSNSTEKEVLLKPGTKLRVVKKWRPEKSKRWRIQLEEVTEQ